MNFIFGPTKAKYWIKAQKLAKSDNIEQMLTFCMFFSFYSKFCLVKSKNEVHICNLHSKTQLLMYDKWGKSTKKIISRRWMEDSQKARTWNYQNWLKPEPWKSIFFLQQMKAEKCVASVQLYRQSAHTEGQNDMLFQGLFMDGSSWFKIISSSFCLENILLCDRGALLENGISITCLLLYNH